ncbi:hypothetical protein QYE76_047830 [Lolium multiflorum]|uniref:Uncharacterized protein n=1 Tax=Lolium multiflorum TaxID=4521 RepID=A0AAD8TSK7_LOLMU|nr:hypothetical protein QYE76_047830 [Lolium multiflorum]
MSGDSMDTEEFDRKVKEYGYGEQPDVESAQPMQVLATVAQLDQQEPEDENTASDPGPSNVGSPLDRGLPYEDVLSPEEIVAQARMDLVAKSDVLNKPIIPGDAADPEALEATRKEMLATAKKFANTAAAILDEREEAAHLMDRFERQDRKITATLEQVKSMRKEWEVKMTYAQAEADRIIREAIPPRRINFATPAEQQPLATPKDNMKKAAEILNKKDEEIDIDYVRKLVASAMQQQSKADTSRRMIREEPKPRMNLKLPGNLKNYDGTERPDTWIEDYYNAVTLAGGTPNIACRMLQLYLVGPALIWLSDLEKNSIFIGLTSKNAEKHFRALTRDPHNKRPMCMYPDHTAADDDAGGDLAATAIPLHQQKKNRDNGSSSGTKRKNPDDQKSGGSDLIAMAFQRGGQGGGRGRGRGGEPEGASSVAMRSLLPEPAPPKLMKRYKRARKHRPRGKGGKGKNKDKDEDSSEAMDEDDASPDPKAGSAAKPNPFDKKILDDGYDFSKCLMDGGASLLETLERMNLTKEQLKHNTTEFHGVVPGKKANSLGSIKLPVGDANNFRQEMITFEVVPFKSSYHVIFGRPTYHKFHARACYIYNKLKIPGPKGMITISGDYKKAHECELGEAAFAESVISGEELQG